MSHFVICAHCETVLTLEPRSDRAGTRLSVHLRGHRVVGAADDLPRWAQLLEHFFFVPPAAMPRLDVRQDVKLLACTPILAERRDAP